MGQVVDSGDYAKLMTHDLFNEVEIAKTIMKKAKTKNANVEKALPITKNARVFIVSAQDEAIAQVKLLETEHDRAIVGALVETKA